MPSSKPTDFEPHARGLFIKPHPETVWPNPYAMDKVEDALRYATPERRARVVEENRLVIASVLSAYRSLVARPCMAKQLPGMRRAIANPIDEQAREILHGD